MNSYESANGSVHTGGGGESAYASKRQHTSAYIRQHTSAYEGEKGGASGGGGESGYVSIRQDTSEYVSIRQRMRRAKTVLVVEAASVAAAADVAASVTNSMCTFNFCVSICTFVLASAYLQTRS
jgi:hypothetical protein